MSEDQPVHVIDAPWNGRSDDANRLEEAATGVPVEEKRDPFLTLSLIGLAIAAVVVILAMIVFRPGALALPSFDRGEPAIVGDNMANQRLTDIRTEQALADARADPWREPRVVDAHVSAFHTVGPVR